MGTKESGASGFSGLTVVFSGLVLLALGTFLGSRLGPTRVQAQSSAISPGDDGPGRSGDASLQATVAELADEVRALRDDQASWELAWESEAALRREETRRRSDSLTLIPAAADDGRIPIGEPEPFELEGFDPQRIEERLNEITNLQHRMLAAFQASRANESLRIPPGITLIEWFKALKEVDSDIVRASHELMSMTQIQQQYGLPDKVIEHDDYIEWVYFLDPEEDTQFDFHFVGGLCTIAH